MFREIRKRDRAVSEEEARDILARAEYGVMATVGPDGWPYAVPLNHVLAGDMLYLHSAREGHKLDNLASEERVSYCAVASASVMQSATSMLYESAIVFGRASVVTDAEEKHRALKLLCVRFYGSEAQAEEAARKDGAKTAVIRIKVEHITGKAHR